MKSTDCYNCEKYPCKEVDLMRQYIEDNDLNVQITLNGCKNFNR